MRISFQLPFFMETPSSVMSPFPVSTLEENALLVEAGMISEKL